MHKRIKSLGHFEYITAVNIQAPEQKLDGLSETELKETLNKIFNENIVKSKKLETLKNQLEKSKKSQTFKQPSDLQPASLSPLQVKISSKESICEDEIAEQQILIHKKETLKLQTEQIRGKLTELQKNYDRITTNYSAFNNSNFASKYAMMMSSRALDEYEKHIETSNNLFSVNFGKLEKRLKTASEANMRRMKRTSSLDIEFEQRRRMKKEFCLNYEKCLNDFFSSTRSKTETLDLIKKYKESFAIIRKFLNDKSNYQDCHPRTVHEIIAKLKELEYRAESLNFTYAKMSEHEARLNQDLTELREELDRVRTLEEDGNGDMKDNEQRELGMGRGKENEHAIIRFYFQLTEISFECHEKLMHIQHSDKELEDHLKENLHQIRQTRIGLQKRRPFNIERFIIERVIGRHSYFETRMEILNSISLSAHEIKSIFNEIFQNDSKKSEFMTNFIRSSVILKLFLDKETLANFLRLNKSESFKSLILNLAECCEVQLMDRFKNLVNISGALFSVLRKKVPKNSRSKEFFSIPIHIVRSQNASPYKVTEKQHRKNIETAKAEVQDKEHPVQVASNVPRVYSLPIASVNRQKVMKEVLENQKKEMLLRTIEKKISKNSVKMINLPYMKRFVLRNSSNTDRVTMKKSL